MRPLLAYVFAAFTMLFAAPLAATELVMIDQEGCIYCERWDDEISEIYPKTSEGRFAPLRRLDIYDTAASGITFARAINFTPTFILVVDNTELARIEGYPGEDFFWGLLEMMLTANTAYSAPEG